MSSDKRQLGFVRVAVPVAILIFFTLAAGGPPGPASADPHVNDQLTSAGSVELAVATPAKAKGANQARASETYGKLPLHFEANQGQTDPQVKFLSRGGHHVLFLTPTEAVLALITSKPTAREEFTRMGSKRGRPEEATRLVLRMTFAGANPTPRVIGLEELPGKANYFIGNDPAKWRTNVPTYAKVRYEGLYPGIDLIYYDNQRQLEYDFVVQPGADLTGILLGVQGADRLEVDAQGDLVMHTAGGQVRQRKPVIYQEVDGVRKEIPGGYVLKDAHQVGFRVAAYDVTKPLVIDPVLFYSTYLGGSGDDEGFSIAVDVAGDAYVAGTTDSSNFPTVAGSFDTSFNGGPMDVFVTKLNPTGSGLVYSTYLGGSGSEDVRSGGQIAVDAAGSAYVAGATSSSNFPTTLGAFQTALAGGGDAFVTKLDSSGSVLLYSTYLGGSSDEGAAGIVVDAAGSAYVAGATNSSNFPTTTGAFQTAKVNFQDGFVTKLNPAGSGLVYSTYVRGTNGIGGLTVDGAGSAYGTGATPLTNLPTTPGAFQPAHGGGGDDAFVVKLNPAGSALVYATYLGGSGGDGADGIAVDSLGNAYLGGGTRSTNFPTTSGAFQTSNAGDADAFVTKLNPFGTGLVYSTYLGGSGLDQASAFALDTSGNAYVTGITASTNFPTTPGAFQTTNAGGFDAFVTKVNPFGTALVYSTYLGGSGVDVGSGVGLDGLPNPNAYVVGSTNSTNFPTTSRAFDTTYNGGRFDAFVAKITDVETPVAVVLIIDEESIDNGNPPNFFLREAVNDDVAEIGVRAQLRFFRDHPGATITLYTGQIGDEGWFALKKIPESWAAAGGLAGYVGEPAHNPEDPPPHGTGPGLGAPDANGDRESLLDKVPDVTPLRATGLKNLEGRQVCAVVYDSDIGINYNPLTGNLKGANLGTVAFEVVSVTELTGQSSSSLPQVEITILDARVICKGALVLLTDVDAPAPTSRLAPFDVVP